MQCPLGVGVRSASMKRPMLVVLVIAGLCAAMWWRVLRQDVGEDGDGAAAKPSAPASPSRPVPPKGPRHPR